MGRESFAYWLKNNRNIVPYSINRYTSVINNIGAELDQYGMENTNLYNIRESSVIQSIINSLNNNSQFSSKNEDGNRMYSVSLNHYKRYLEHEENAEYQAELRKDEVKYEQEISKRVSSGEESTELIDREQDRPEHRNVNNRKIWRRNSKYASDAIAAVNYLCECNGEHKHFVSKYSQKNYVEAHHLIPMKFQEGFQCSLDVYANIVSVCVACHKKLHFGLLEDKKEILEKLYESRRDRLFISGIRISLEDLYSYYQD